MPDQTRIHTLQDMHLTNLWQEVKLDSLSRRLDSTEVRLSQINETLQRLAEADTGPSLETYICLTMAGFMALWAFFNWMKNRNRL